MAPTTGRGADLPAASVQIGPSAYPVFYAARKTGPSRRRTLLSVAVAVGCERATTAAAERWRHARQRHPSRPLSPRLPPRRSPRFFFSSSRVSEALVVRENLSASSPRLGFPISRGELTPRLPQCFHSHPSASSTLLRMRASFPLKRRNVVLVSKPSFSLSVLNLLPRGYLVFLGSTYTQARG